MAGDDILSSWPAVRRGPANCHLDWQGWSIETETADARKRPNGEVRKKKEEHKQKTRTTQQRKPEKSVERGPARLPSCDVANSSRLKMDGRARQLRLSTRSRALRELRDLSNASDRAYGCRGQVTASRIGPTPQPPPFEWRVEPCHSIPDSRSLGFEEFLHSQLVVWARYACRAHIRCCFLICASFETVAGCFGARYPISPSGLLLTLQSVQLSTTTLNERMGNRQSKLRGVCCSHASGSFSKRNNKRQISSTTLLVRTGISCSSHCHLNRAQ